MRPILFITRFFPPVGGAGVQRAVKFAKYLPDFGILPMILAGPEMAEGRWTPSDCSMLSEVPSEVSVFRAGGEGSRDMSLSGRKYILRSYTNLGDEIIRKYDPQLIFVTMSPFEDSSVAAELSGRYGLPWVADLRDPWALDEFQVHPTRWHRCTETRKMEQSLKSASLIIMNTPEAANQLRNAFPALAVRTRVTSITNGYDAEDFSAEIPLPNGSNFTIVHSGYMHTGAGLHQRQHAVQYRVLGRMEPGVELLPRSHFYLLKALEKWRAEDPAIGMKLRVVFVGSPTQEDQDLVNKSAARSMVSFTGYLPHAECLRFVRGADLLFLSLHKMPKGRRASIVPGKTYEYMATGKPILAAVPDGDARDFITKAGTGLVCAPDDVEGMGRILHAQYQAWQECRETITWNRSFVDGFERRMLARQLADEFDHLLAKSAAST